MSAPLVEAEQDGSIRVDDLPKVVVGGKRLRLAKQRLVPFEASPHIVYRNDRPRALHRIPLCEISGELSRLRDFIQAWPPVQSAMLFREAGAAQDSDTTMRLAGHS